MLKHHEEVQAEVARIVDNCANCREEVCEKHCEIIENIQHREEFDVTGYLDIPSPNFDQNSSEEDK